LNKSESSFNNGYFFYRISFYEDKSLESIEYEKSIFQICLKIDINVPDYMPNTMCYLKFARKSSAITVVGVKITMRVETTLERVIITLISVIFTRIGVKTTLVCVETTLCV
jgi:hypothetical protein